MCGHLESRAVTPDALAHLIDRHVTDGWYDGAALAVVRGETTGFERFSGHAGRGLPAGPRVLWPLASITKLFTAAVVMRLVELGELTVNTPVWQVLRDFTGEGREDVRVRHLLTHTSGLPYESPAMGALLAAHTSVDALIDEAYRTPLQFAPGTRFQYSDYAYGLAGRVAATVSGMPYLEAVRALVLEPMGLSNTFMLPADGGVDRIATVRGVFNDGTAGAMYNSAYGRSLAHPAFSAVSSLHDMVQFFRHFAPGGPRVLSEATVRAMTSLQTGGAPGEHPLIDGFPTNARIPWGLGFALQTEEAPAVFADLASFRTFGHPGASGCQIFIDPVADVLIALLTNTHIRIGRDTWLRRQQELLNAALTLEE